MARIVNNSNVTWNGIANALAQSAQNTERTMQSLTRAIQLGDQSKIAEFQTKLQQEHARFNMLQSILALLSNIVKQISDSIRALAR